MSRFILKMRCCAKRRLTKAAARVRALSAPLKKRARSGSAAIEFAFVAPVFLLFLMGTLETGIMYLSDFVLQNATNDAARQIRTGQVAANGTTQTQFRNLVCNGITPLLQCSSNLQIDVQTFPSFAQANITNPLTAANTLDPNLKNYSTGTVCSIVLVRVFYTWDVATPLLTPFLVNMAGDKHLLTAAAAFRNEPFNTAVAGC